MNIIKAFRTKSRIRLSGLISVFTLIFLFACAIFPASAAEIETSREISAETVYPGQTFAVTVHIKADYEVEALILDENLPDGWQVSQWESKGVTFQETSTFKASTLEWLWVENLSAGEERTVIYNVTVPSNSGPGNFTISGRISSYSVPATPVEGFSEVRVTYPPPKADFSATPFLGTAPLIVRFTDLSLYNPDSWEWDFDENAIIDSNQRNPIYTYETPGTYTVTLKATNSTYGSNILTKTEYITVTTEPLASGGSEGNGGSSGGSSRGSSGGSSGSGGGGVAGSPESTRNIELKEISNEQIFKDIHTCFTFKDEANEIVTVELDPKKNFGKTTAIVEMLKNTSSTVKQPAPGNVYRNVNIWVGNSGFSSSENFESARINFRVSKTWLIEQGVSAKTVTLYRYNQNSWNPLSTIPSGEDNNYLYFTAETPGFSSFAISSTEKNTKSIELSQTKKEENKALNESNLSESEKHDNINSGVDKEKENAPNPGVSFTAIGLLTSYVILSKRKQR